MEKNFKAPEYETIQVTDYVLIGSDDFNWSQDNYTKGMYDLMYKSRDVYLDIIQDNGSRYNQLMKITRNGLLEDYGGGFIISSRHIILSNRLQETTPSNRNSWTLGGVVFHELLYHIHPLGKTEQDNPNTMRIYYNLRTGGSHKPGSEHINIR